jgi:phosphoenolpyruvate carboxykinase (GTP)
MLPFCGYNMGDYFGHWLAMGERTDPEKLPRVYFVNWFRKGADGAFLWPGYGENSRVLDWIVRRLDGDADGVTTPIGVLPTADALNLDGLELSADTMAQLLSVDLDAWQAEAELIPAHFERFGDRLPAGLWDEYQALLDRIAAARG